MKYQRFLTPTFNPLDLAKDTEKIVTKIGPGGLERKYTDFYSVPVYGGISTGYGVGCCLRCIYCWSNWSRDFPERFGVFYSPKVAVQRLFKAAEDGIAEYKSKLYVRVSFKAATRQGFTRRTGAIGKYYNLPFRALRYLLDEGIYVRAAAMTDPEIMPLEERDSDRETE